MISGASPKLRKPKRQSCAPSILLFNARSVFPKLDDLKVRASKFSPDIICVTESWLDATTSDLAISLPGYSVLRQDRDSNGGGVILYYKSTFNVSIISDDILSSVKSHVLSCYVDDLDTTVVVVYHPYWGAVTPHDIVLQHLQLLIDNSLSSHFLIVGDINDLRLHYDDFCVYNDLCQLVKDPTRNGNILDVVITNQKHLFRSPVCIAPLGRSDHKGVFVQNVTRKPVSTTKVSVRSCTPSTFAQCRDLLRSVDWATAISNAENLDLLVEDFQFFLLSCYESFFPSKTVRMRSTDPPWLTPSLKALSDSRDKALSRGNVPKFLQLREKFLDEASKSKLKFYSRLSSASTGDTWKSINSQLNRSSNRAPSLGESSAIFLNDKFADVFHQPDLHHFENRSSLHSDSFSLPFVSEDEVFKLIKRSKANSRGPDGLPGFFYRLFADILAFPLSLIFNLCLRNAAFPSPWKLANVIPLPKKGSPDHRPISILPFPSKILEKLIKQLVILPSLNHELDSRQFGFISNGFGGCTNALLSIRLTILDHISLKPSNVVNVLAVDFQKAFDTVSHLTLLETLLNKFDCNPFTLRLICSFLSNRKQRVCSNEFHTPWKDVTSGVPQGSILGPLLFTLLVDDFPSLNDTQVVAYADDFTLLHLSNSDSANNFQSIVDSFVSWSLAKKLVINVNKTKCMTFTRSCPNPPVDPILINGFVIESVSALKILGIVFETDLSWNSQFSFLYKKCCHGLSLVKRLRSNYNNSSIIWLAYMSFVFSQVAFCWPVICDLRAVHLRKLERLDRIARRWAGLVDKPPFTCMLENVCKRLIHKIATNKFTHPLSHFFIVRDNESTTISSRVRHQRVLLPKRRKHVFYNKSFVKFSSFS